MFRGYESAPDDRYKNTNSSDDATVNKPKTRAAQRDVLEDSTSWTDGGVNSSELGVDLSIYPFLVSPPINMDAEINDTLQQYQHLENELGEQQVRDTCPFEELSSNPAAPQNWLEEDDTNPPQDRLGEDDTNPPQDWLEEDGTNPPQDWLEEDDTNPPQDWLGEDDTNPPSNEQNSTPAPTKRMLPDSREPAATNLPKKPKPSDFKFKDLDVNFKATVCMPDKNISKRLYCNILNKIYVNVYAEFPLKFTWNENALVGKKLCVLLTPIYVDEAYTHMTVKRCRNHENTDAPEHGVVEVATAGAEYTARGAVRVAVARSGEVHHYRAACLDHCLRYDFDGAEGKRDRGIKLVCTLVGDDHMLYGSCNFAFQACQKTVRTWKKDKKNAQQCSNQVSHQYITIRVPCNRARDMLMRANRLCQQDVDRGQDAEVLRECMAHNQTQELLLDQNIN